MCMYYGEVKDDNFGISDVNECERGLDNCISTADCTDTIGNFTCACKPGYSGDGSTCTGKWSSCKGTASQRHLHMYMQND